MLPCETWKKFLIEFPISFDHKFRTIIPCPPSCGFGHSIAQLRTRIQARNRYRQRSRISRRHQHAGLRVHNDIRDPAHGARNNRQAELHRIDQDRPESFPQGRQRKKIESGDLAHDELAVQRLAISADQGLIK